MFENPLALNLYVNFSQGQAEATPRIPGISYAKLFFKKSGYITKEWYPYLLAVRRGGITFEEAYKDGTIRYFAKLIYDVVHTNEELPIEAIKSLAGFAREDKSGFDKVLTDLQMKMFLTVCGQQERTSMPFNVFCTTERFFGTEVFKAAGEISNDEAMQKLKNKFCVLIRSQRIRKSVNLYLADENTIICLNEFVAIPF